MDTTHETTPRFFRWLAAALVVALPALYFVVRPAAAGAGHASVPVPIVPPLGFEPIGFFAEKCEHCHGAYGLNWVDGLSRRYTAQELTNQVAIMCEGVAQSPLDPARLEMLVAYIRSLDAREVFIDFTKREGGKLRGEVTPGCVVELIIPAGRTRATVMEHEWSVPADPVSGPAAIVARKEDGRSARLDLTTHNSTHSLPAAYPDAGEPKHKK